MQQSKKIKPKENEWKEVFRFAFIHILGAATVLNLFSTLSMISLGAYDQVSVINQNTLPITFVIVIGYSFFIGRKVQSRINKSQL